MLGGIGLAAKGSTGICRLSAEFTGLDGTGPPRSIAEVGGVNGKRLGANAVSVAMSLTLDLSNVANHNKYMNEYIIGIVVSNVAVRICTTNVLDGYWCWYWYR